MGVQIYFLSGRARRQVRIGSGVHRVGLLTRGWKVTETGMRGDRIAEVAARGDAQQARRTATPRAVLVEGAVGAGAGGRTEALRMLGWETGRLMTQDLNWDHMPQLGWAVFSPDGPPVLHEEADGSLVPVSDARAHDLGILGPDGRLAEQRLPTIAECLSVSEITAGHYCADCILDNGRHAEILGESESGDLGISQ